MSRRWAVLPVLLLVLCGSCAATRNLPARSEEPETAVELSVFAAVLDTLAHEARAQQVVVEPEARGFAAEGVFPSGLRRGLAALPGVEPATLADFEARNESSLPLVGLPRGRTSVRFGRDVDPRGTESRLGVIRLSRVGINPSNVQALVVVELVCPGLCGSGRAFLLARQQAGWRVVADRQLWIS